MSLVGMVPMPRSLCSCSRLCSIGFQAPSDGLGSQPPNSSKFDLMSPKTSCTSKTCEALSLRGQLEPAPDEGLPAGEDYLTELSTAPPVH